MNRKSILSLLGFGFFFLGLVSIILSLVGMTLKPLAFLHQIGSGVALLVSIIMLFGGAIIMYMVKTTN